MSDPQPQAGAEQPPGLGALRRLPRPVLVVLAGVAVNRLGSLLPIFLVLYLTSAGLGAAAAGVLLAMYGTGSIAGVVVGGWLVDRFGVRSTIVASMLLAGLTVGVVPFVSSYSWLVAVCLASGLLTEIYRPAATTMLAEAVPAEDLVVVSAAYRLVLNIGATLAPVVGGLAAAWSLRLVFVVDGATSLLFALLAATQLPAGARSGPPAESSRGGYRAVLRDAPYRRVLAGMFLIAVVDVQYLATLPLEVTSQGLGRGVYAGLLSLNGLLVLAVELPATRLTCRWRLRTAITLGVGLIGAGITLMSLRGGIALLVAATVVWTLGEVVSAPSATAYPALLAPGPLRGRYLAAMGASQSAGYAVGPIAGTLLLEHGRAAVGLACAATGALATVAMWTGVRSRAPLGFDAAPGFVDPPHRAAADSSRAVGGSGPAGAGLRGRVGTPEH